ncbi:Asp-tRNA(Asn)/Glu-tRNA(Gln) amidotransferase subunit GatB, partial [bacterium]|nr:Asp-tRNA(Asn)/Glu-tRNA(Gln) amidotransferase subunit GatB [bacterium]
MKQYETVIGLEIHAQLKTNSKIFCPCKVDFNALPNTLTCEVCLGLPGTLPVLNKKALELALRTSVALNCEVSPLSTFARKNYFYPDLPKGFQITQQKHVLARNGYIEIEFEDKSLKRIRIARIQLEEDAGKSIHVGDNEANSDYSLVDYNRCGTPLIEIITEPDIRSPKEARTFLNKLKTILLYLDVCDCNMEEGSLRCDSNISLKLKDDIKLGTKTELKNLNSFKNIQKALEYEEQRQFEILESGGIIDEDTLTYDDSIGATRSVRSKEQSHDYRYFPEPDLVKVTVTSGYIDSIKTNLPELPDIKKSRFIHDYNLSSYDASVLTSSRSLSNYFEEAISLYNNPKKICNWITTELLATMDDVDTQIIECKLEPKNLALMVRLIDEGRISGKIAKQIFPELVETGKSPEDILKEKGITLISEESEIKAIVKEVIIENPDLVEQIRNGKDRVLGFLVGQV